VQTGINPRIIGGIKIYYAHTTLAINVPNVLLDINHIDLNIKEVIHFYNTFVYISKTFLPKMRVHFMLRI